MYTFVWGELLLSKLIDWLFSIVGVDDGDSSVAGIFAKISLLFVASMLWWLYWMNWIQIYYKSTKDWQYFQVLFGFFADIETIRINILLIIQKKWRFHTYSYCCNWLNWFITTKWKDETVFQCNQSTMGLQQETNQCNDTIHLMICGVDKPRIARQTFAVIV